MSSGLIIASGRLPVTLSRRSDGWEAVPSPGGLVAALRTVMERSPFQWLGWPGTHVPDAEKDAVRREVRHHHGVPVFVDEDAIEGFYQGYSNQTLWPLLHSRLDRTRFEVGGWNEFRSVNRAFAEAIAAQATEGDAIWVHDYQLCLVPEMLRDLGVTSPVGFFLHTPFPPAEVFRNLPQREHLLRGILGADVVGFQAHEYASHFRQAARHLTGSVVESGEIGWEDRVVEIAISPVGVDPLELRRLGSGREARQELATLQATYAGRKIIVGVDRFDYTKGIPQKLRAFEVLLERYPRLRQRVVLIQVAQPSRTTIDEYQQLKREVDELVGRINGRFGSSSSTPVVCVSQTMSRSRIVGLFRAADCALVTPIVDGMNLVALEYIAARGDREGTLVLSEFTGAAQFLPGARLVNPHDALSVADTLAECLEAHSASTAAFCTLRSFVDENTAMAWAEGFVSKLRNRAAPSAGSTAHLDLEASERLAAFDNATSKLVVFGEGAIMAREGQPSAARISALDSLSKTLRVCGLGSHMRSVIESWNLARSVGFLAEGGNAYRNAEGGWSDLALVEDSELRGLIEHLLLGFTRHVPGSSVEFAPGLASWSHLGAEPDFAALQCRLLLPQLEEHLRGHPYVVRQQRCGIVVRHTKLTMEGCARQLARLEMGADWILFFGDPRSDRELFTALQRAFPRGLTRVSVAGPSRLADAWLDGTDELLVAVNRLEKQNR